MGDMSQHDSGLILYDMGKITEKVVMDYFFKL